MMPYGSICVEMATHVLDFKLELVLIASASSLSVSDFTSPSR